MTEQTDQITIDGQPVTVLRSAQRRKTISLELVEGRYLLRAPAGLADDELHRLATRLIERHGSRRRRQALDDDGLRRRADELNRRYFDGRLRLIAISYVTNQRRRYGSCSPATGVIRISESVARLPDWVRDYILVHELAHLAEPNHGPAFWALVNRYPLSERARGYLMALGMEEGLAEGGDAAGAVIPDGEIE